MHLAGGGDQPAAVRSSPSSAAKQAPSRSAAGRASRSSRFGRPARLSAGHRSGRSPRASPRSLAHAAAGDSLNVSAAVLLRLRGATSTPGSDSRCCSCTATRPAIASRGIDGGRGRRGVGNPLHAHGRRGVGHASTYIAGRSALGVHEVRLEGDRTGGWRVDGKPPPQLDGCLEVDLEASAFTNALPVHRLGLGVGRPATRPPPTYAPSTSVWSRLEQSYVRLPDIGDHSHYDYASPAFDFRAELVYDQYGLVLDYPGIAVRVV